MKDKQIKVIKRFKHFTPFTDCISEVNNAQIDNTQVDTARNTQTNLDIYGNILEMSQVIF